ncbi:MAG: tetratricopeptide repeat protein [Anaerolineae bacterium]|nr:tetratricopeptide repeat protein [Anaerolineae bacterium]
MDKKTAVKNLRIANVCIGVLLALVALAPAVTLGAQESETLPRKCDIVSRISDNLENSSSENDLVGEDNLRNIYWMRGQCALAVEDYQSAIALYEKALEYRDSEPQVGITVGLAQALIHTGKIERAKALMDALQERFSFLKEGGGLATYQSIVVARAEIYTLANDFDTAIEAMDSLIAYRPDLAIFRSLRGQIYLAQYEWDKALEDFNTAIELAPDDADAYYQRGLLYYSILQTGVETRDEALADFEHYLELDPLGQHAQVAARYAESIRAELEALEAPAP